MKPSNELKSILTEFLKHLEMQKDTKRLQEIIKLFLDETQTEETLQKVFLELKNLTNSKPPNFSAITLAAICYQTGFLHKKDLKLAFNEFTKASKGDSHAFNCLADFYRYGIYVKENFKTALHYYQKAALQKNAIAEYKLAEIYQQERDSVKINLKLAFEKYKLSANYGYDRAQYKVAEFYANGTEVEQDSKLALDFFKKSALQNNKDALFEVGYRYQFGIGTEIDLKKALAFYKKSIELGNDKSQYVEFIEKTIPNIEKNATGPKLTIQSLTKEHINSLIPLLEKNKGAFHWDLYRTSINEDTINRIENSLKRIFHLKISILNEYLMIHFFTNLAKNTSLHSLYIDNTNLNFFGYSGRGIDTDLRDSLTKNETLHTLSFKNLPSNHVDFYLSRQFWGGKESIKLRKLEFIQINLQHFLFSFIIKDSKNLHTFNLSGCGIGNQAVSKICHGLLQKNTALTSLDLTENNINDEGAACLAQVLEKNTALRVLKLEMNYISDHGIEKLCEALSKNTNLQILEIGCNEFGDKGFQAIIDLFSKNNSLKFLKFENNGHDRLSLRSKALELYKNRIIKILPELEVTLEKIIKEIQDMAIMSEGAIMKLGKYNYYSNYIELNEKAQEIVFYTRDFLRGQEFKRLENIISWLSRRVKACENNLASLENDSVAQNELGMYHEFYGTKSDLLLAKQLYTKAANNGYAHAQFNLGKCYHYENDLKKAIEYYRLSAEQGFEMAKKGLSLLQPNEVQVTTQPISKEETIEIKIKKESSEQLSSNTLTTKNEMVQTELKLNSENESSKCNGISLVLQPEIIAWIKSLESNLCLKETIVLKSWAEGLNTKLIELETQLIDNKLIAEQDFKAQREKQLFIDQSINLKNYQKRVQKELTRFIHCYFLATAGILKLEDNLKAKAISAIEGFPVLGYFLKILTKAAAYANEKYRFYQYNHLDFFEGQNHINLICQIFARELTFSKAKIIEEQIEIEYKGIDKVKSIYHFVKDEINNKWRDLKLNDKTGIKYTPQDKLAVLDVAFLLQQILSGSVKIKKNENLVEQFINVLLKNNETSQELNASPKNFASTSLIQVTSTVTATSIPIVFSTNSHSDKIEIKKLSEEQKRQEQKQREQEQKQKETEELLKQKNENIDRLNKLMLEQKTELENRKTEQELKERELKAGSEKILKMVEEKNKEQNEREKKQNEEILLLKESVQKQTEENERLKKEKEEQNRKLEEQKLEKEAQKIDDTENKKMQEEGLRKIQADLRKQEQLLTKLQKKIGTESDGDQALEPARGASSQNDDSSVVKLTEQVKQLSKILEIVAERTGMNLKDFNNRELEDSKTREELFKQDSGAATVLEKREVLFTKEELPNENKATIQNDFSGNPTTSPKRPPESSSTCMVM